jgi:hypothetical protein
MENRVFQKLIIIVAWTVLALHRLCNYFADSIQADLAHAVQF